MADEIAHEHANFKPTVRTSHIEETVGGGDAATRPRAVRPSSAGSPPSNHRGGSFDQAPLPCCHTCAMDATSNYTSTSVIMSGCKCLYLTKLKTSVDSSVQLRSIGACMSSGNNVVQADTLSSNSTGFPVVVPQRAPRHHAPSSKLHVVTACGPSHDGSEKLYSKISIQIKSNHGGLREIAGYSRHA